MKFANFVLSAVVVGSALAVPFQKRQSTTDVPETTVLNYALTLEHLENAFYRDGLAQFDAQAFTDAGYPSWVRGRFEQIAAHEASHVAFLSTSLGELATKECTYNFPYTDVQSFIALSSVLENVGTSAYVGASGFLTTAGIKVASASITSTEARHAAWINSAVLKQQPWSGPYDTPLDFSQVYSVASTFLDNCPSTNAQLPVTAFPLFNITGTPGSTGTVSFDNSSGNGTSVAFLNGLSTVFAPLNGNSFEIPSDLQGTSYAFITNSDTEVSDSTIVAGPAIYVNNFASDASNAGLPIGTGSASGSATGTESVPLTTSAATVTVDTTTLTTGTESATSADTTVVSVTTVDSTSATVSVSVSTATSTSVSTSSEIDTATLTSTSADVATSVSVSAVVVTDVATATTVV